MVQLNQRVNLIRSDNKLTEFVAVSVYNEEGESSYKKPLCRNSNVRKKDSSTC